MRILFSFIFLTSLVAFGQDSSIARNREFYLTLADFSPVNIHLKYKHQMGERTYLKIGLVNLSAFQSANGSSSNSTNVSGGIELGIEFRKQLTEKFAFFHGPNLRYTYQLNIIAVSPISEQRTDQHTVAIPYSVGVLFNLTPNLLLGAEINPSIYFNTNASSMGSFSSSSNGYGFSLDNRAGSLSLVMRF